MEWLLAHGDDPSLDEPFTEEEALQMKSNLEAPLEAAKKPLTEEEKAEKLAKLEELRKVRRASILIQLISCSDILFTQVKKAEREEKEKLEAKEKEQKRIASGKDMGAIRQQIEEQEIKKMAEQRRREKQVSWDTEQKIIIYSSPLQEEKAAKAKVLAQIEADKAARRAEREAAKNPAAAAAPPTQQPAAAAPAVKKWVVIICAPTE